MKKEYQFRILTPYDFQEIETNELFYENGLTLKANQQKGCFTFTALESGINKCKWHKVVLNANIPENSEIKINYYMSDDENSIINWDGENIGCIIFKNTKKDALIFDTNNINTEQKGNFITLKIELSKAENVGENPILKQVQVFYQRLSYLRYLPANFQSNSTSKNFLERFLSNFETSFGEMEQLIQETPQFFDPEIAPDGFYPWLASWLSLELYDLLEDKNREFILNALNFYKKKGTIPGIADLMSFIIGKKCLVKEYFYNVLRTYGMNHYRNDVVDIEDDKQYSGYYYPIAGSVNTADKSSMSKIGSYSDKILYVNDATKQGKYSKDTICLFIFVPLGIDSDFIINEDKLMKIIQAFVPVFVKVKIELVQVAYENFNTKNILEKIQSVVHSTTLEAPQQTAGIYNDQLDWEVFFSNYEENQSKSNDLNYRTQYDKNNTWQNL